MPSPRRPPSRLRRTLALVALLPAAGVLCGGHCHWYFYHHCHDEDCRDRCHRHCEEGAAAGRESPPTADLTLRSFRLDLSREPGAHPVARVYEIADLGTGAKLREEELRTFTAAVHEANRSLLGLPPSGGALVFEEAHVDEYGARVRWLQIFPRERPLGRTAGRQVFVLDASGRLLEIENRIWLD